MSAMPCEELMSCQLFIVVARTCEIGMVVKVERLQPKLLELVGRIHDSHDRT